MSHMPTASQRLHLNKLSTDLFGVSSRWKKILDSTRVLIPGGWRRPTLEEVTTALEQNLAAVELSKLPQDKLVETLAKRFLDGTLSAAIDLKLSVYDSDQPNFDDIVTRLPADLQSKVKALVYHGPHNTVFSFSGEYFVKTLLDMLTTTEET